MRPGQFRHQENCAVVTLQRFVRLRLLFQRHAFFEQASRMLFVSLGHYGMLIGSPRQSVK
jgi:hypothetical protein